MKAYLIQGFGGKYFSGFTQAGKDKVAQFVDLTDDESQQPFKQVAVFTNEEELFKVVNELENSDLLVKAHDIYL